MRKTIKDGNLKLVKELINNNEELLSYMTGFGSWLHVAAAHNKIEILKYFLDSGIDVDVECSDDEVCIYEGGAIACASSRGNLECVKILYDRGAKLDTSTVNKNPLFCAIPKGQYEIAKFLIDNGIDITVKYDIGTCGYINAYEYAKEWGQKEIADYIQQKMRKF